MVFNAPRHDPKTPDSSKARDIALANLESCIEPRFLPDGRQKNIVCAGWRNFREPWARDFGFAGFGLLSLGYNQVVKEGLETFLEFQRPNGQFPIKLHSTHVINRYIHSLFDRVQPTRDPLKPKYLSAHQTLSLDGNFLLTILWAEYVVQTEDWVFAEHHHRQFRAAVEWVEQFHSGEGLIRQRPFSDWADTIGRGGVVLYTNVLYWKALQSLESIEASLGVDGPRKADSVRGKILDEFWDPKFGYLKNSKKTPLLSTDGNLLAVAWGLTEAEQSTAILARLEPLSHPVPTRCTDRNYPAHLVGLEVRLAGIPHYHTSCAWLWLGGWHVVALAREGRLHEAEEMLGRMQAIIELDTMVYELHAPCGRPLKTLLYAAEAPLSWNASMFLYAQQTLEKCYA